jgi:hypothetical protein
MKKILLLSAILLLTLSCAPKVKTKISQKYAPLDYKEEVVVLEMHEAPPGGTELLGTLKIGDAGMTMQCNYAQVLEKARVEARKFGGNIVKITDHKLPDFMSTCHRITADVLRADPGEVALLRAGNEEIDSSLNYAILYVYRRPGPGALISYNLNLGDSVLCRVTNKCRQEIKIDRTGSAELWAKTESKAAVPIELIKGKTYYLRCAVSMGVMVGRPSLELVTNTVGRKEYENNKAK